MVNVSHVCEKRQLPWQAGALMELLGFWVQPGQIPRPSWPALMFSMNEAWEREVSVKNISFKTRECYWYEAKHPHAWLSGVSISHPRTWHWDPWLIREAGLWKSRNLGIGFWQRARWHGDMPLQLSWTRMTWVCYWGEKRWHTHTCTRMHMCMNGMSVLYGKPVQKNWGTGILEHDQYIFLENKYPVIIWLGKIKHKRINCHNIEISCLQQLIIQDLHLQFIKTTRNCRSPIFICKQ